MAQRSRRSRQRKYFQLSSRIAQIDNAQLSTLLDASESSGSWGRSQALDLEGSRIFVKRIPVTDVEQNNMFSTRNLYDLPTYYNYGVGSAGFGAFRELVAHIKTTNWVLNGDIETFPLLYHYRIVPFFGERASVDPDRQQRYVEYWGSNENIRRYMIDRANASAELVLFLEHIPHVLEPWLKENPDHIQQVLDDLRATIDFLRKNGIIHFDAHFYNALTDGKRTYLTDFGLVLDRDFALSEDEKAFFKANTHYDYGEVLSCLDSLIYHAYKALSESDKRQLRETYGVQEESQEHDPLPALLDNIEAIQANGVMQLNERYLACVIRYRSIIALMNEFYAVLRRNKKKDTQFPHAELQRLLYETGFVSDTGASSTGDRPARQQEGG